MATLAVSEAGRQGSFIALIATNNRSSAPVASRPRRQREGFVLTRWFRLGYRSSSLAACLCVAALVAACDESFEPIEPTELAFSVFGYLDATAETQWIRVMPIRPLTVTAPDTLAATVTLEHVETGQVVELKDSLITFRSVLDTIFGFDAAYLHNFWTSEDIEPGASYRFSARLEGKEPAEAVVEIPSDYEIEVAFNQFPTHSPPDSLRIFGVKHVPFLRVIGYFYDLCGSGAVLTVFARNLADEEPHVIAIGKAVVDPRRDCGRPVVEKWEVWMAASEAVWPADDEYSPNALGDAGLRTNVTNAVGFLGGVLTKVIPYEDCRLQSSQTPVPNFCRLRYNQETARVIGTVTGTGMDCPNGPLDRVKVQLTELDRDTVRVRTAFSDRAGEFMIGALEPGIPHFMLVSAPPIFVGSELIDVYSTHTDTLTFLPGQQMEYDISLQCIQPPTVEQ